MNFYNQHKALFYSAFILFVGLTIVVAILPALKNQKDHAVLPNAIPLTTDEMEGKKVYIANGCVACHTQQVRSVEMDKTWGDRPSAAADYAGITRTDLWRNTATLMGTQRTGPDLTNIGNRQPSQMWHLIHLYQPRAVVENSIMPSYPWLFEYKQISDNKDVVIQISDNFKKNKTDILVAKKEALQLVAYIQSLRQSKLQKNQSEIDFLYKKTNIPNIENKELATSERISGKALYASNCMSCHQAAGTGLMGAFPALKGSPIVLGNNIELITNIIWNGFDARQEYAVMNAVGKENNLSATEITAIINFIKTSWGNKADSVEKENVQLILNQLKTENNE